MDYHMNRSFKGIADVNRVSQYPWVRIPDIAVFHPGNTIPGNNTSPPFSLSSVYFLLFPLRRLDVKNPFRIAVIDQFFLIVRDRGAVHKGDGGFSGLIGIIDGPQYIFGTQHIDGIL